MSTYILPDPDAPDPNTALLTDEQRLNIYRTYGFTDKALTDKNESIRYEAYNTLYPGNFPESAKDDESPLIELEYYRQNGFTEECKENLYWKIRYEAYEQLGGFDTEQALYDIHWKIKMKARTTQPNYDILLDASEYDLNYEED